MKAAAFEYRRPSELAEALDLLSDDSLESRVLAGGQSLVPMMALRLSRPELLVDLNGIEALRGIRIDDDWVRIGAMTRQHDAEHDPVTRAELPILPEVLHHVGHVSTRHRGTIGGSIAHGDPAAELVALAVLVDAACVVHGPNGVRSVPASQFFDGYFSTALQPGEILVEVLVPRDLPRRFAICELSRRAGDFAMAGVIAAFDLDGAVLHRPRLVAFAVGPTPVRGVAVEAHLDERTLDLDVAAEAGRALAAACSPAGDIHASAEYRRDLVATLTRRCLVAAAGRGAR